MKTPFEDLSKNIYGQQIDVFARGNQELESQAIKVCYPAIAAMLVPEEYAALVLTARMDAELRLLLTNVLHRQGDVDELCFSMNAPLSTFSSKISLAYVCGLLTQKMFEAINCCRQIRNAYAHNENPYTAREDKKYLKSRKKLLELNQSYTSACVQRLVADSPASRNGDSTAPNPSEVTAIMVSICDNLGVAAFYSKASKLENRALAIPAFYGPEDAPELITSS